MKTSALLLIFSLVIFQMSVRGEKMDLKTHDMLISKLRSVLPLMEETDTKRIDVLSRLADLLSERARLEEINPKGVAQSQQDRNDALELYKKIYPFQNEEGRGRVLMQMAQLDELLDHSAQAYDLYTSVVEHPKMFNLKTVGLAYTKLGDWHFHKVQYESALIFFRKAREIEETPRPEYVQYRMAWCLFHQDRLDDAISQIESALGSSNPSALSFKEEASRDLATFLARDTLTDDELNTLVRFSPPSAVRDNLIYLADELDRLGKKSSALFVLTQERLNTNGSEKSREKMERQLRIAGLQYDTGAKEQSIKTLAQTLQAWSSDCDESPECELMIAKLHKMIVDWNRIEKSAPSSFLISAYDLYLRAKPDAEMFLWAAQASRTRKDWNQAARFYHQGADLVRRQNLQPAMMDGALLGEIEVSEISKDFTLRQSAYEHYLYLLPKGAKAIEVRYQYAHLFYEKGQYALAARYFHEMATQEGKLSDERNLKEKAADLALDSLALVKNDSKILDWAKEFSDIFPERKNEYLDISRKTILSHVSSLLQKQKISDHDKVEAGSWLRHFSTDGASDLLCITFYKDKLILSELTKDLQSALESADSLLSVRELSPADRTFALSRKEWVEELSFNFKKALDIAKNLDTPNLKPEDKFLKLSMLSELAGDNPAPYYKKILSLKADPKKEQFILFKWIKLENSPGLYLHHINELVENPEMAGELALEIFESNQDFDFGRKIIKNDEIKKTTGGIALSHILYARDFSALEKSLEHYKLDQKSAGLKTLNLKIKALQTLEGKAQWALDSQNWMLQAWTLNHLAHQYKRFAVEISDMPTPRGLTTKQRAEFHQISNSNAQGYIDKAKTLLGKVEEIWRHPEYLKTAVKTAERTYGSLRKILLAQINGTINTAPPDFQQGAQEQLQALALVPSEDDLQAARASVIQEPFDREKILELKTLEERAGKQTLVSFLDARLNQLRKEQEQ